MRLCNPPLLWIMFSIIHEAAEPQITTTKLVCWEAHVFQKCSKAGRKPDFWLCSQGNSSKNRTVFSLVILVSKKRCSMAKACSQFAGTAGRIELPLALCRHKLKFSNCSRNLAWCIPDISNANSFS